MQQLLAEFAIFVIAAFLGWELIQRVPTLLHTPLMSATNAIHGIVLVGAILALVAAGDNVFVGIISFIAVIGTLCAETAPRTEPKSTPIPIPTAFNGGGPNSGTKSVATRAMIIPRAAKVFPERAVSGVRRRRMPIMNSAAATR